MIKKELIQWLKQLQSDEIEDKITIMKQINQYEIDINEFLQCSNDFTKCITIGIGSLDNEYLTETLKVMIQWIEVLIEQPKIQIKCYDTVILQFLDGLFYALNDKISIYLSFIKEILSISHIFITRHLSQLMNTMAFHIQTHSNEIIPIIEYLLNNVDIPELLWNECILFLYTLYHFTTQASDDIKSKIKSLFVLLQSKYQLLSSQYIKSYLSSLSINDNDFDVFLKI